MRVEAPAPQSRRLSLTSLIDVIFLLLLFFMLSSTFTRYGSVPLINSAGSGGVGSAPEIILSVKRESVLLNGEALGLENLPAMLRQRREGGATSLLILTGAAATSQDLVSALEIARASGLTVSVAR